MARKRKVSVYKGSSACKSDCSGHRAGAIYARSGGRRPSAYSRSFNNGMRIELGTFKRASVAPKRRRKSP